MNLEDERVKKKNLLLTPKELKSKLPNSEKAKLIVLNSRENIKKILNNEDYRLLIIVGPCSIHNYESALEYAKFLKKQKDKFNSGLEIVMRTYFQNLEQTGWKGFI